jgi:hypothetical protein
MKRNLIIALMALFLATSSSFAAVRVGVIFGQPYVPLVPPVVVAPPPVYVAPPAVPAPVPYVIAPPFAGAIWIPGHWVYGPRGRYWVAGYWAHRR